MKDGLSLMAGTSLSVGALSRSGQDNRKVGVSRTSLKSLVAIPTTCKQCPAGCGVIAYLNGDRLVQILGNPDHPNNLGGICAKGIAGINLVNDPDRLLFPMKRIGPRGENRWSRITWDEAFHTLSTRIGRLKKEGRTEGFVADMGQSDFILERFLLSIGRPTIIDRPLMKNINRSKAFSSMTGHTSSVPDVAHSRTILNFGANPFANHDYYIGIARRLAQGRIERGTKLITFDVRMSETAAQSDEWHPVKPASDGSIALAMAQVIVNKGMADSRGFENLAVIPIKILQEHLSLYTPEWAERESGVAAKDVEQLAMRFASQTPSVAMLGGGAFDHGNGYQNTKCISLLNWLVGNVGKTGGIYYFGIPQKHSPDTTAAGTISRLESSHTPVDTYFCILSNPGYDDPECGRSTAVLKDEKATPFLVVMDTHMTETAMIADLVLPAATYLEGWGMEPAPPLDGIPKFNLRQPVVSLLSPAEALRSPSFDSGKLLDRTFRPLGEAMEIGNVFLKLAKDIGWGAARFLSFKNTQDFASNMLSSMKGQNANLHELMQTGFLADEKSNVIVEQSQTIKRRFQLPDHRPLPAMGNKKPDQFVLTTFKTNLGTRGMENSKWAREIFHESRVWLNEKKAEQMGIRNGDRVRVTSSVGKLTLRARITGRIHPDSIAIAEGLGHTAFGSVAQALKSKSRDRDTQLLWWAKKEKGVNPFSIIENRMDPEGGGHASKDTLVRVQKIEE